MSILFQMVRTPFLVRKFLRNVNYQQRFLKQQLGPLLDAAAKTSDGSLGPADFKKIYTYYGLAVPCILGEELAVLRGKPLTERERLALSFQGAMTGLFDDFFDRHEMPESELLKFIEDPGSIIARNSAEKLFLETFQKALEFSHDPKLTVHYLRKVHLAQVESLAQVKASIPKEEIERITIDKGGVSVLFYRSVMEHPMRENEERALYRIGGLMQFGNDIFDVHKDFPQGIRTLMTSAAHVSGARNDFRKMEMEAFKSMYDTGYEQTQIMKFLRMVSLSLCARSRVCLDQYESLERKNGGIFDPSMHSREELICDLDTAANKWRSVKYFWRQKY